MSSPAISTCPWCSQPEGHTGVCGRVQETKPPRKMIGRPRVAKFANGAHAIIAIYDDSTTRVWWLRSGKWAAEQSILEALWQVSFEVKGAFEVVTLEARIGAAHVRYEGICLDRRDAARLLKQHPSPTDEHRILRDEYGGTTDGAAQDTTWQQKVRGTRPW